MTYLTVEAAHVFSFRSSVTFGPQFRGLPPQRLNGSVLSKGGRSTLAANDSQTLFPLLVDVIFLGAGNESYDR